MSFGNDLKFGEIGESIVWNSLSNSKNVRSIIDVRKDKRFQQKDIDFIIETNNRSIFFIEVKTDRELFYTDNIVYEKTYKGNAGCSEFTKSDYIYYVDPIGEKIYVINTIKMRYYVNKANLKELTFGEDATGYLLNIELLKNKNIIEKVLEI